MALKVNLLKPFAAEILDADCSAPAPLMAADIIKLVARHRVLVFRGQSLSDTAFVDFLVSLGPLMFTDGEIPVAVAEDLNIVSIIGRTVPPRSVFHTDTSYVSRPPAYTALKIEKIPIRGGCTIFSDQVAAASALSENCRNNLKTMTMRHACTDQHGRLMSERHPILRRHPVSGETALYLSTPEKCSRLGGLPEYHSARLISLLYR